MSLSPFAFIAGLFTWNKVKEKGRITAGGAVYGPAAPAGPFLPKASSKDVDTLARTIWGEARGDGYKGMQAVANTILNRYRVAKKSKGYAALFGSTVSEICTKPYQFSVWLKSDPNRGKMLSVTAADPAFRQALEIAELALKGDLTDLTGGSTHYHTKSILPGWAKGATAETRIGTHVFYRPEEVA